MARLQSTKISRTNNLKIPKGTTAQRPSNPAPGDLRFNTTLQLTEIYDGTNWILNTVKYGGINAAQIVTTLGQHVLAKNGPYTVHNFLSGSHTFTPGFSGTIEVLVVAGGGAGGSDNGGGGGAGGVVYRSDYSVVQGTTYTVTVGAGGISPALDNVRGTAATNSVFGDITALAGGEGGTGGGGIGTGLAGGSGGGGNGEQGFTAGIGTEGQGHPGGAGVTGYGGGGGGAGGPGQAAKTSYPANSWLESKNRSRNEGLEGTH
jgi:hypothetical protein